MYGGYSSSTRLLGVAWAHRGRRAPPPAAAARSAARQRRWGGGAAAGPASAAPAASPFVRFHGAAQRDWPHALARMSSFVGYCSALHARRARDAVADRGARWYAAVAHHLRAVLRRWQRRARLHRLLRLLHRGHLRLHLSRWRARVRSLTDAERALYRVLCLWSRMRQAAAFRTWHARTDRAAALAELVAALRRAWLGSALRYWRGRHLLLRWRWHALRRRCATWRAWTRARRRARALLARLVASVRARTTGQAFAKWYGAYLLLKDAWDKQHAFWGTSLHRMVSRQYLRRALRTWVARTARLSAVARALAAMCAALERAALRQGWRRWRRGIFEFKRRRRRACGCARALAKSRKGLGWCYKCSSLTHLQNRIEDSVELIEGMAFRIAKTALAAGSVQQQRGGGKGGGAKSWRRRRGRRVAGGDGGGGGSGGHGGHGGRSSRQRHGGEAALDRLLGILDVDRTSGTEGAVPLRDVTGRDVDNWLADEGGDEIGRVEFASSSLMAAGSTASSKGSRRSSTSGSGRSSLATSSKTRSGQRSRNSMRPPQMSADLDLEKSIGLKSLAVSDGTGRLRRTFVSQSARDSFERLRLSRENTENGATHGRNTQTQSERRRRGGGLKAEQDGLAGSRTGW